MHQLLCTTQLPAEEIAARTAQIERTLLSDSTTIRHCNFKRIATDDLELLFDEYNRRFFDERFTPALGDVPLEFRLSSRMTRAGGKTTRHRRTQDQAVLRFEIAVSTTLLFQTFDDDPRPITVAGIVCHNRLEALQRIFEHELLHLAELLVWTRTNCATDRFYSLAHRFFGHTAHTHELMTPREHAQAKYGIAPGVRVRFRVDGRQLEGIVNRVTKRATVLVADQRGRLYSDGNYYAKYYVPISQLTAIDETSR